MLNKLPGFQGALNAKKENKDQRINNLDNSHSHTGSIPGRLHDLAAVTAPLIHKRMTALQNKDDKNMVEEKEYYSLNERVFRKLAPFYDFVAIPISRVRKQVVDFANAKVGAKVLDVAIGTGKQAVAFARRNYDVTGIDVSDDMLRIARKKNKYPNLKFIPTDATMLPFESSEFDVSTISFALHDMPMTIRKKTLNEMMRVTKPTGMIVIVDYALPRNKIGRFLIYNVVRLYEGKTYRDFIKSDLKGLLSEAGIEVKEELPVVLGAGRVLKGASIKAL